MYLVTGGCGFIGSHLVDLLLEKGHQVRVIDDLSSGLKKNLSPRAEFVLGSITDKELMIQALKGVKGVFHLAAIVSIPESILHWHQGHLVNCAATVLLFENAKTIPIVYASSAAVYGNSSQSVHKEDIFPNPLSPYAVDKRACEMHAQVAWHLYRTPSVACRFFNVYGPRQNANSPYSGVISKFANKLLHKEPLIIYGDGNQSRDFINVKDIAKMLYQVMQADLKGAHIYNFCTGKDYTINALADLMGKAAGMSIKKEYLPARQGDVQISRGDPTKALNEMGLKAVIPLEAGLSELMQEME